MEIKKQGKQKIEKIAFKKGTLQRKRSLYWSLDLDSHFDES